MPNITIGEPNGPFVCGFVPMKPNGADLWRIMEPLLVLHQLGHNTRISNGSWQAKQAMQMGGFPDVMVVARQTIATKWQAEGFTRSRWDTNTAMVYDLDDDLWRMAKDSHRSYNENPDNRWLNNMIERADVITTTTPYLAETIKRHVGRYCPPVAVVPNLINLERIQPKPPEIRETITIGLQGAFGHAQDWRIVVEPLRRVLKRHPYVRLKLQGYPSDELTSLAPDQTEIVPWQPYLEWASNLGGIDIGLAPLSRAEFNLSKSPIKWMEYSTIGAATICSPTVYEGTVEHDVNGLIARSERDWEDALEHLISDNDQRFYLAATAQQDVITRHSLQARANDVFPAVWWEAIKRCNHAKASFERSRRFGRTVFPRAQASLLPSGTDAIHGLARSRSISITDSSVRTG